MYEKDKIRLFWSEIDQEYVATLHNHSKISNLDPDPVEAILGLKSLIKFMNKDNDR